MFHAQGAYDGFDSLSEVRPHYKRCRNLKHFILSKPGVITENPVCCVCGNKLLEVPVGHPDISEGYKGNRCVYSPKTGKIACMHYICAWTSLLNKIFANADRLY